MSKGEFHDNILLEYPFGQQKSIEFLRADSPLQDFLHGEPTFTLEIKLGNQERLIIRKVYTLLNMIGAVGGLHEGLLFVLGLLLNLYNRSLFESSLVETLFTL